MINVQNFLGASRDLITVSVFLGCITVTSLVYNTISEQRWVRDLTRQTPFYVVDIDVNLELLDAQEVVILKGEMRKNRCVWNNGSAYITNHLGVRFPAILDVSLEEDIWGGGNRPPSGKNETFGPWVVKAATQFDGIPITWEAWVSHKCPDGVKYNLFSKGAWPIDVN